MKKANFNKLVWRVMNRANAVLFITIILQKSFCYSSNESYLFQITKQMCLCKYYLANSSVLCTLRIMYGISITNRATRFGLIAAIERACISFGR